MSGLPGLHFWEMEKIFNNNYIKAAMVTLSLTSVELKCQNFPRLLNQLKVNKQSYFNHSLDAHFPIETKYATKYTLRVHKFSIK
jgi:hypothetical protein